MAAEPETYSSSSSSFASSSDNYEVFLSFRGEDTRTNFIDLLYNALDRVGIRTFRDEEELKLGDEIGPGHLKAIEESRIAIPVLSKNYASSKYCLKELTKIMECMENDRQVVWPIFYKVDPSRFGNQTGSYAEEFLEHEKNQCKATVDSWRKALKKAAKLKGWHSEDPANSCESELINSVVNKAMSVLNKTPFEVAKRHVGIDSRVEEVLRLFDKSKGISFMVIHGMGGIGKTTIAKAVYDRIFCDFERRSFLADIRDTASREGGLVKLQNNLVCDISKFDASIRNDAEGIQVIKQRCSNMKVLIILDDVYNKKELDALAGGWSWLGHGSKVIITSRNIHILNGDHKVKHIIYQPEELDGYQSLQLFSRHAFGTDKPQQNFRDLSEIIVNKARGLPLALELLGSFLYDYKTLVEWKSELERLNKIPHTDIQKILEFCYDGLHEFDKELFLNIACFFNGMDKEIIIHILEDYFPAIGIPSLVRKSLIKIDDDDKLRMHDLLRDMGREIARQQNYKNPETRRWLWSHYEALNALDEAKGSRNGDGILLSYGYGSLFLNFEDETYDLFLRTEYFEVMSKLELLRVDYIDLDGNFGHLPRGLKWLTLKGHPLKCLQNISHLEKLVALDMSGTMITEDWNGWQHIQLIKTLKVIDLYGCNCLTRTPDFSSYTSLERLILESCEKLVTCHESIGHLKKLVFLSLKSCRNLQSFPCDFVRLSLKSLDLSNNRFCSLPASFSNLSRLETLNLKWCRELQSLPELPSSLIKLNAMECISLERLPNLSNLESLKNLCLENCKKLAKIEGINGLTLLQELDLLYCEKLQSLSELPSSLTSLTARGCISMERLPDLSNLKKLRELNLQCENLSEIHGISGLTLLQELHLTDCRRLQFLSELPSSLTRLTARGCMSMERLPDLSNLKKLRELNLQCENLSEIHGISDPTLLQELHLTDCRRLQSLSELPSSLTRLTARGCMSMERLPDLSNLKKLRELNLQCENLSEFHGTGGLTLLQELHLTDCRRLQSLSELPSGLTRLTARGCISMERLPDLSNLKKLRELNVQCENLSEIHGISGLTLLQELHLTDCGRLQFLSELPSSLNRLSLTRLNSWRCKSLIRLPDLSNLKELRELTLQYKNPSEIQGINGLTLLQELKLTNCEKIQASLEFPSSSTSLTVFPSMERSPDLSNLKNLGKLELWCDNLSEIQGISALPLLQVLHLEDCHELQSLPKLPSSLISLNVLWCDSIERLDLSNLKNLKVLYLVRCFSLAEIQGLESLETLTTLSVRGCERYVKTLPKIVAQGTLPFLFDKEEIRERFVIPDDDNNIKGAVLYFVYQLLEPASSSRIDEFEFSIGVDIRRNDGQTINCFHVQMIEDVANTYEDLYISCYFQGLTWFGIPLEKGDQIQLKSFAFETEEADSNLKLLDFVVEHEAVEEEQQLEKRVMHLITSRFDDDQGSVSSSFEQREGADHCEHDATEDELPIDQVADMGVADFPTNRQVNEKKKRKSVTEANIFPAVSLRLSRRFLYSGKRRRI